MVYNKFHIEFRVIFKLEALSVAMHWMFIIVSEAINNDWKTMLCCLLEKKSLNLLHFQLHNVNYLMIIEH